MICNIKHNGNRSIIERVLFVCIGDLLDPTYVGRIKPRFQFKFGDQITRDIGYEPQFLEFNPYEDDSAIIFGKNLKIEITPKIDEEKPILLNPEADFS